MKSRIFFLWLIFMSFVGATVAQNGKIYTVHVLKIEQDSSVMDKILKDSIASMVKRAFSTSPKYKLLDLKNLENNAPIDYFLSVVVFDYVQYKMANIQPDGTDIPTYNVSFTLSLDYINANNFEILRSYLKPFSSFKEDFRRATPVSYYSVKDCMTNIWAPLWLGIKQCTRNLQLQEGEVKGITMLNEKGTKAKALQIDFPNGEIPQKGEKFEIFKILKIYDLDGRRYPDIEQIGNVRYDNDEENQPLIFKVTSGESDIKEAVDAGAKLICKRYFSWYEAR